MSALPSAKVVSITSRAMPTESEAREQWMQTMDLQEVLRIARRRAQLIIGVTVASAILALIVSLLLTPQYRSEAVVMLNARKTQVLNMDSVVSGLPLDNANLRSEMDIISSSAIIGRVVDKLNLTNDVEFYKPTSTEEKMPAAQRADVARNKAIAAVGKKMKVENDGRSYGIHISFMSKDPRKAALIANSFADEYLVDQLETKFEASARANKWLSDRLGDLKQRVEVSEKAVESYRQKSNLIDIGGSTVVTKQLEEINSQLVTARAETSQAEARMRSADSMLKTGGVDAAADVLASPLIQRLREQEAELRRQETEMATRYGDQHPKIINIRAQYHDLENKIAEEVQKIIRGFGNEVDIARAKENQLQRDLQSVQARAGGQLKETVALRQLEREADANRTLYQNFLNRFKQTDEQQDMQSADSRVIARATPATLPSFPVKSLFIVVGAVLGVLLGALAAYLVEYFDRGFRGMPQVEELTGFPAIGLIPSLAGTTDQVPELYVVEKPLSTYSESLRTVRTAVQFSNVDQPPKTVMVTSALPNEGKSTFCLSLARSLGLAGNRILLIDADLRRPSQLRLLQAKKPDNKKCLSAVLTGDISLDEAIIKDPKVANLHHVLAFGKTPNAQDILGSQQMEKLIREAGKRYDLVIVDTPPILAVSDAALVSRIVDTTIFLVRWAETPREAAMRAIKQLSTSQGRIAGVVLTQVDLNQHAKYGYGDYGYYYSRYHEYYSN